MRLVVATRNRGKLRELRALLAPVSGVELVCLADLPDVPEVVEDGETFLANATKKAREVAAATGLVALADDSGLLVDALGGEPGVRSARFAGEDASDADNNAELLRRLEDVPDGRRGARFRCVVVAATPAGELGPSAVGECEGRIGRVPRGASGFGYDPLFEVDASGRTMAELSPDAKAAISHRGRALRELVAPLAAWLATLSAG